MEALEYKQLKGFADERGVSFSIPKEAYEYLGSIEEGHITTIAPGAIRGNHYHSDKKEIMLIIFEEKFLFAWASINNKDVHQHEFNGGGAVLIKIQSNIIHAVKNSSEKSIILAAFCDKPFDPQQPDQNRYVIL